MRSAAFAIGWEFRRRHLWPLVGMAGYLLLLAAAKVLILGPGQPIRLDPPDGRAALVIVPLSATFFYYLAVFSFGLSGDLGARQSIYPARMFALPVKTSALAGWPMLYGTGAVAILWLTAALLARWPWGIVVPLVWPAVLAAGFLAWTQALTWMPYGLPGLRVIVTVLLLAALDAVVLVALHFKAGEPVMLAILAPQVPLAFLVALFAVARARRGDVPDWRPSLARRFRTADRRARRNRCEPAPAESAVAIDVTRIDYPNCADSAAVVLYRIQGGGHTWPGGKPLPEWFVGTTSTGVDATARMWTFFREQPLSRNRQVTIPRVH